MAREIQIVAHVSSSEIARQISLVIEIPEIIKPIMKLVDSTARIRIVTGVGFTVYDSFPGQ